MSADHDAQMREVTNAEWWELAMIGVHVAALLIVLLTGAFGGGWPGLWWQLLGTVWGVTILIGVVRSVRSHVPSHE